MALTTEGRHTAKPVAATPLCTARPRTTEVDTVLTESGNLRIFGGNRCLPR